MKFKYTGIRVRDLKRSVEFYTKTMGMKQTLKGTMHAGGVFVQLRNKDSEQTLELNYYPPGKKYCEDYVEGSELDHLAFWCKDVRAEYKKTLEGGATSAIEHCQHIIISLALQQLHARKRLVCGDAEKKYQNALRHLCAND